MRRNLLFSTTIWLALSSAALAGGVGGGVLGDKGGGANAAAAGQSGGKAVCRDQDTRVKLPPPSLGPDKMELNNNEVAAPEAGPTPRSVIRGSCILPYGSVRYRLITAAPQIYTFRVLPSRNFDVVMRI